MTAADLKYVFDRLDMNHVHGCAAQAREAWQEGEAAFEVNYQPGDGTHYGLLFVPLDNRLHVLGAPGGGTGGFPPTQAWGGVLRNAAPDRMFVYWIQRNRGVQINEGSFIHPSWLESALEDQAPASVLALAVLLNLVIGNDNEWIAKIIDNAPEDE